MLAGFSIAGQRRIQAESQRVREGGAMKKHLSTLLTLAADGGSCSGEGQG